MEPFRIRTGFGSRRPIGIGLTGRRALLGVTMSAELERPLEVIQRKMRVEGTWILENPLDGRMLADVEATGK